MVNFNLSYLVDSKNTLGTTRPRVFSHRLKVQSYKILIPYGKCVFALQLLPFI